MEQRVFPSAPSLSIRGMDGVGVINQMSSELYYHDEIENVTQGQDVEDVARSEMIQHTSSEMIFDHPIKMVDTLQHPVTRQGQEESSSSDGFNENGHTADLIGDEDENEGNEEDVQIM